MDARIKLIELFTIVNGSLMIPGAIEDEELQDLWDTNLEDLENKFHDNDLLDISKCRTFGECIEYMLEAIYSAVGSCREEEEA